MVNYGTDEYSAWLPLMDMIKYRRVYKEGLERLKAME